MNTTKLIQNFQNLIIQNKMSTLRNFKNEINKNFVIFSFGDLEKIYAFIEVIQKHPMRCALSHALKRMFEMLLKKMINEKYVVNVLVMKTQLRFKIETKNIQKHFKRKKIINTFKNEFIIPYKPNVNIFEKKEEVWFKSLFYNTMLNSFNLYEHEQNQNCNE